MSHLELLVFSQVVRSGGISKAADDLGIAKSAVSKQLARLEERLQVKLLIRSARRLSLTPEGENLLPMVESLIAETRRLVEVASDDISAPAGRVRVATSNELGQLLMARLMPEIAAQYPKLRIGVKLGYGFDDLQDPAFDLAFRIGRVSDDRLVSHQVGTYYRVLVAHPALPGLDRVREPTDLQQHECMIFSSEQHQREWPLVHSLDPEHTVPIPIGGRLAALSFSALCAAAEAGAGITYLPNFVARAPIDRGSLVRVLPDWRSPDAPVFLAYRYGSQKIARIRAVIDLARELIPPLLREFG